MADNGASPLVAALESIQLEELAGERPKAPRGRPRRRVKNLPAVRPDYLKISPASVADSIKRVDEVVVKLAGTAPLTEGEAQSGGAVIASTLDHYMPLLVQRGGLWLKPVTWIVLTYGPRAFEVFTRARRREKIPPALAERKLKIAGG